ncbi:MAG: decarboxylase [Candidatus Aminicenantes bacterium]|nr:decarboxylase [Candidatus Aminicenantes bacterium]
MSELNLTWENLHKLGGKYGDSFYIWDIAGVEANFKSFLEHFRNYYKKTTLAYSYKTNYLPALCALINRLGGYAEVVSRMEYDLARGIGAAPRDIIFNGPVKSLADIEDAALSGSIVNIDSFYEIDFLKAAAAKSPSRKISIGIRCNFDVGEEKRSRFGVDVESDALENIFQAVKNIDNIEIAGLHCHFSTAARSVESFALRTGKMAELSKKHFKKDAPRFIDIGGGFFGPMAPSLARQFSFPIPAYREYAQAAAGKFAEYYEPESGPELIVEPGIAIVGDTMKFAARIVGVKKINGRNYAVCSGTAFNIKPSLHGMNLPLKVLSHPENRSSRWVEGEVDIVGFTCVEKDCLYEKYTGRIYEGDYVLFEQVGGYTIVLNPPFISPLPAILAYDAREEEYYPVRKPGTFEDVFSPYVF